MLHYFFLFIGNEFLGARISPYVYPEYEKITGVSQIFLIFHR